MAGKLEERRWWEELKFLNSGTDGSGYLKGIARKKIEKEFIYMH